MPDLFIASKTVEPDSILSGSITISFSAEYTTSMFIISKFRVFDPGPVGKCTNKRIYELIKKGFQGQFQ